MKCVRAKGVLIFKCLHKDNITCFLSDVQVRQKVCNRNRWYQYDTAEAMSADVAYQAIINNSSKIRMSTIIDIITASDLLSLVEIENNEEIRCFSKNRKVDIPGSL